RHEVPYGEGNLGRDPRPLGPDRSLLNLHHELLAFFQQLLDGPRGLATRPGELGALVIFLAVDEGIPGLRVVRQIRDMDEGRPFHSDVDKSRLHAWKDFDDLPFVDVPDE